MHLNARAEACLKTAASPKTVKQEADEEEEKGSKKAAENSEENRFVHFPFSWPALSFYELLI